MRAIQERALDLFDANGFGAVTIEEIAAAAEVSPSSVYRYFGTKEGILVADEFDAMSQEAVVGETNGFVVDPLDLDAHARRIIQLAPARAARRHGQSRPRACRARALVPALHRGAPRALHRVVRTQDGRDRGAHRDPREEQRAWLRSTG